MKNVFLFLSLLSFFQGSSQTDSSTVKVVGAMRNVMWKGELFGTISLDTIQNRNGLCGLGPTENLNGELLIVDGRSFASRVNEDGTIRMEETYQTKAPFFVYTNETDWKEVAIEGISSIIELEDQLTKLKRETNGPFVFKIKGKVAKAQFHIQNLPAGTVVRSPEGAHVGQMRYELTNEEVEIVGFYSTAHQGIFTHHDSFVHMHIITADYTKMGHLDSLQFKGPLKLYLPEG